MTFGVAKFIGAASVLAVVAVAGAGAAASSSGTPSPLADTDREWQYLAIRPVAQGSGTGSPHEPAASVELVPPPAEPQYGPVRLSGVAGTNLNAALAEAGVSASMAQAYLGALSGQVRLADGISVADRFDLIIDREPEGEQLLYAGLDRVAASDVQLMRWAVDGKAGWIDATGTAAQAEAMRMPVSGRVSSGYGMRFHPILHRERFHRGLDLKASLGAPIRASADGRISFAGWAGGYGRQVRIGHDGGIATSYSHMSRIAAAPGQWVRRGDVIGYVGSSGFSTGPHLHYEVFKNGKPVNPASVRTVGGSDPLDRQERHDFNARLRSLLMGKSA